VSRATTTTAAAAALAAVFLAAHLPFLPASLEDVDSINFALGIRDFDVARHQPHPPGYPVYVVATKAVNSIVGSQERTLALVGIVTGALAVLAFFAFYRTLARDDEPADSRALAATLVAATAPLFWFTAARPLSDVPGLAAAVGIQALILRTRTAAGLGAAAAAAGFGAGIRSQVVWLTVPLMALQWLRCPAHERGRAAAGMAAAYAAGALAWAVPLIVLSGGPAAYWSALVNQGAEDLGGVAMLWTQPTARQLILALRNTFLLPWNSLAAGAAVTLLAALGAAGALRSARGRRMLGTLAAAYGPYYLFDLLFQETVTTRYALPLIVPLAFLAVAGAWQIRPRVGWVAASAIAAASLALVAPALQAYATSPAPAFRMLADMRAVERLPAGPAPERPVLGMHRRASFDLRRPLAWEGDRAPVFADRLSSPPKHEWLELVRYWNGGGRLPIWFVADPLRSDLALVDRGGVVAYRWPFDEQALLGGVRPGEMDWHRFALPGWYLGEGWALTPETAGVAREDGKGPGRAPIQGWILRRPAALHLLIGGRNMSGAPSRIVARIDDVVVHDAALAPGFFLHSLTLPPDALTGPGDYAALTVSAGHERVAVEQFDAQPEGRIVFGFDEGWHEPEYNPATGGLWRWASERATLRVIAPRRPLVLRLAGEIERVPASRVTVRVGDRVVADEQVGRTFALSASIPAELVRAGETPITIESSAWYVPAEQRFRRSQDRRRLALKVLECAIAPVN
jgi:hypothetical protein